MLLSVLVQVLLYWVQVLVLVKLVARLWKVLLVSRKLQVTCV